MDNMLIIKNNLFTYTYVHIFYYVQEPLYPWNIRGRLMLTVPCFFVILLPRRKPDWIKYLSKSALGKAIE